jgi:hypothetical protein
MGVGAWFVERPAARALVQAGIECHAASLARGTVWTGVMVEPRDERAVVQSSATHQ